MQKKKIEGDLSASIVVPVYKNAEFLKKNLPKLLETALNKKNRIIEIIVVDDATPDSENDFVRKDFKNVRFIKHSVMRGYSATVNTGARTSKGKLIVLLNCDAVPAKDFLEHVYEDFKDNNVFAVALRERGYSWDKGFFKNGFVGYKQGSSVSKVHETFYVSTACGVYRRDYWMKIGGLDERVLYPSYWEDIDLCYRAAKRGFLNIWNPKAKVSFGAESAQVGANKKINKTKEKNRLLFHWKNITSAIMFRKHLFGLFRKILSDPLYITIVFSALRRLKLVLRARKREIKEAKISDEAIIAKFQNA